MVPFWWRPEAKKRNKQSRMDWISEVALGIRWNPLRKRDSSNLREYGDCFATSNDGLGLCTAAEHKIETGNARPIKQSHFGSVFKEREVIQGQVEAMLEKGIIEESNGPWSSPVVQTCCNVR